MIAPGARARRKPTCIAIIAPWLKPTNASLESSRPSRFNSASRNASIPGRAYCTPFQRSAAPRGSSGGAALSGNHCRPDGEAAQRSGACGETPPILLTHGDQDGVLPVEAMFMAANELGEAGIPCQWHLSFGIGHGIDGGALRHGGEFLAKAFGAKK